MLHLSSSSVLAERALQLYYDTWARNGVLLTTEATRRDRDSARTFRFVIPATPLYLRAKWARHLAAFANRWYMSTGKALKVGVAWELGGRHVHRVLRTFHLSYFPSVEDGALFSSSSAELEES